MTEPDLTAHVTACAWLREPYRAPVRLCPVCSLELPAGYGRHPGCDARWLQPSRQMRAATTQAGGESNT